MELLDIPYVIAEDDDAKLEEQTRWAVREARAGRKPSGDYWARKVYLQGQKKQINRFKISDEP